MRRQVDKKSVQVRITADLHKSLKIEAAKKGTSIKALIEAAFNSTIKS